MEQRKPVSSEPNHPTRAEAGPQEVRTEAAPAPVGPYSQGIAAAGPFLFAAGQVGLDPKTGKLAGEDVASQTRQALLNLKAVLEAGGTSLANVVKTTVFLADMKDFAAMNAVYREFFAADPAPARSCVQVAGLPLNALVEIEAVACYR
ncbi:2-iminobutanoate/2-iminopropanoate deaminase [Thermostichus sp. MS-CIW-21]|jgi:endoribonuclease L-PSP, putative|uniref:RidA family protein n=1 Tax=unclassified Synechococcus TaxID=2626047 RepID=UPI0003025977|nr:MULTISPECIES: RidA family protein [unclassified Synechococcus]PIK84576.1 endoribonuclease L-PSP [Synechococcus sp. 65AY6A5]PIK86476.1 endoribonuclease L-PSP [Synechococcus sp. 63AY4M2]PIK91839.1 endoribonuclease L-PSP [Synechococcus sp. 65AY6Li]PIK95541.1 endoribonuclease L-PSP [Synechococcus sp. 60AY4M2]PIK97785.1 endoribonuclease L-PSP [Synechococcus sp. 63AY4M1]